MKIKIYADEAWRWPLAWPVLVWLTLPLEKFETNDFKDSKILTEKKRKIIYENIKKFEEKKLMFYSFWYANNKEIDNFWIIKSINIAFKRALIVLLYKFSINYETTNWDKLFIKTKLLNKLNIIIQNIENIEKYDIKEIMSLFLEIEKIHWIIFDWNHNFWLPNDIWYNIITIIKWDAKIPYIGAWSIIAKVERDNYMIEQSKIYLKYSFEKHKWYWTKTHIENIKKYWICHLHRKSFLKNYIEIW